MSDREDVALKPCPFCGGKAVLNGDPLNPEHTLNTVCCVGCDIEFWPGEEDPNVVVAWNRRALLTTPAEPVAWDGKAKCHPDCVACAAERPAEPVEPQETERCKCFHTVGDNDFCPVHWAPQEPASPVETWHELLVRQKREAAEWWQASRAKEQP